MTNELGLMERFANPEYFQTLTFGEKLSGGAVTLLLGMGMTFLILCIIWGCIVLMGKLFRTSAKKAEAKTDKATETLKAAYRGETVSETVSEAVDAPAPAETPLEECENDPVLIAVITAAIAASEGGKALDTLRVTRISRIAGTKPVWGQAGLREALDNRTW